MIGNWKWLRLVVLVALLAPAAGCDDPHVYGSVGVSSGWGRGGGWGSGVHTSISVGGRIY